MSINLQFVECTQYKNWIFLEDTEYLRHKKKKEEACNIAWKKICELPTQKDNNLRMLNLEEEFAFQIGYFQLLFKLGRKMGFPFVVLETAATYFRRYLTRHSVVEVNLPHFIVTCIFLACKTEERFIEISQVFSLFRKAANLENDSFSNQQVVDYEIELIESINFDLLVIPICQCIEGMLKRIELFIEQGKYPELFNQSLSELIELRFKKNKEDEKLIEEFYGTSELIFRYQPQQIAYAIVHSILSRNDRLEVFIKLVEEEHGSERVEKFVLPDTMNINRSVVETRKKKKRIGKIKGNERDKIKRLRKLYGMWREFERQRILQRENERRQKEFFMLTNNNSTSGRNMMKDEDEEEEEDGEGTNLFGD